MKSTKTSISILAHVSLSVYLTKTTGHVDEDLDEEVEREDVVMLLALDRDCRLGSHCHGIC